MHVFVPGDILHIDRVIPCLKQLTFPMDPCEIQRMRPDLCHQYPQMDGFTHHLYNSVAPASWGSTRVGRKDPCFEQLTVAYFSVFPESVPSFAWVNSGIVPMKHILKLIPVANTKALSFDAVSLVDTVHVNHLSHPLGAHIVTNIFLKCSNMCSSAFSPPFLISFATIFPKDGFSIIFSMFSQLVHHFHPFCPCFHHFPPCFPPFSPWCLAL